MKFLKKIQRKKELLKCEYINKKYKSIVDDIFFNTKSYMDNEVVVKMLLNNIDSNDIIDKIMIEYTNNNKYFDEYCHLMHHYTDGYWNKPKYSDVILFISNLRLNKDFCSLYFYIKDNYCGEEKNIYMAMNANDITPAFVETVKYYIKSKDTLTYTFDTFYKHVVNFKSLGVNLLNMNNLYNNNYYTLSYLDDIYHRTKNSYIKNNFLNFVKMWENNYMFEICCNIYIPTKV
jgi:hypothetical protein